MNNWIVLVIAGIVVATTALGTSNVNAAHVNTVNQGGHCDGQAHQVISPDNVNPQGKPIFNPHSQTSVDEGNIHCF